MTKRVPSGSGRDGREESGAPGPRFCLCALPWDSQKQSTARLGGQDDPPGSPLCSTALPPGRPHAPTPGMDRAFPWSSSPLPAPGTCAWHLTGSGRNPCSGGLSSQRQHTWCVSRSMHTQSSSSSRVLTREILHNSAESVHHPGRTEKEPETKS